MRINDDIAPEKSILLRYGANISEIPYARLQQVSIAEGARILDLGTYQDVRIHVLDLSSLSTTGTFKDLLAALTIADCVERGVERIMFQSSGNTGNALSVYAHRQGIKTLFLYPKSSNYKINPDIRHELGTSVECDVSEPELKRLLAYAAEHFDAEVVPTFSHQILANKLRAYFLEEMRQRTGVSYDWHVQALSSAYGIFGYYAGVSELAGAAPAKAPKLLGIQQEAVAPFANRFSGEQARGASTAQVIEPTLFRMEPGEKLFSLMQDILAKYGGAITILTNEQYARVSTTAITMLEKAGIRLCRAASDGGGDLIERAGVIALSGCLRSIERGEVRPGESALVVFTGGAERSVVQGGVYRATHTLSGGGRASDLDAIAAAAGFPRKS